MSENYQETEQQEVQGVKLALDLVEAGDDSGNYGRHSRVSKQLPQGVTSKLLYKDVVRIAWPAFIEFTLTQLTSMVDMMMVGQLGSWAIAAVGLTNQPKFLMATAFMAMNVGATALIARAKGAGDQKRANLILRQAILLTAVLSAAASVLGFIYAEPLIKFMGAADEQTLVGGTIYLQIQMAGMVIFALTSTFTAALRGVGNSRIAMTYNLTSNAVNVFFNYCMIYGKFGFPRWEVAGASLATVIGQTVAFILAFIVVLRVNILSTSGSKMDLNLTSKRLKHHQHRYSCYGGTAGYAGWCDHLCQNCSWVRHSCLCHPPDRNEYSSDVLHEWTSLCCVGDIAGRTEFREKAPGYGGSLYSAHPPFGDVVFNSVRLNLLLPR